VRGEQVCAPDQGKRFKTTCLPLKSAPIEVGPPHRAALSDPWRLPRPPLPIETSLLGVLAVGEVRRGGVKRLQRR
jgi:hypothetical protein